MREVKVGEKVRVVDSDGDFHGFTVGSVVECIHLLSPGRAKFIDRGVEQILYPRHYEFLDSPEEIVKAVVNRHTRNKVYVVVHKDRPDNFLAVTSSREEARDIKSMSGGKAEGYIILQFGVEKEVR